MTNITKIKSIEQENREDAKQLLEESMEQGFDSVIVLGFRSRDQSFAIRNSKVHNRLALIGALREAEHRLIMSGGGA